MNIADLIAEINDAKYPAVHQARQRLPEGASFCAEIDHDEHRWYILATYVYKVGNSYIGLSGLVSLKSESMSWGDAMIEVEAFEMEAVPSVTYRAKP